MEAERQRRLWRTEPLLGGLALLLLLSGCFFVLRPFMTALMWAIILTYSLYPLQRMFTRWFRGSRTLAACFVTLTVTILFAGPVVLIGVSIAQDGKDLALATRNWFMKVPDKPPAWVGQVPVVGDEIGDLLDGIRGGSESLDGAARQGGENSAATAEDRGGNRGWAGGAGLGTPPETDG